MIDSQAQHQAVGLERPSVKGLGVYLDGTIAVFLALLAEGRGDEPNQMGGDR